MTPQTAASMIVKVIPDGTEPADLGSGLCPVQRGDRAL